MSTRLSILASGRRGVLPAWALHAASDCWDLIIIRFVLVLHTIAPSPPPLVAPYAPPVRPWPSALPIPDIAHLRFTDFMSRNSHAYTNPQTQKLNTGLTCRRFTDGIKAWSQSTTRVLRRHTTRQ